MSASVNRFSQRSHHVVGDRVGGGVHGERVEAARGVGEVQQRARALRWHRAHGGLGGVALGVEHDHRAPLAAQVLGDGGGQVARLALLHRARHGGVLAAHPRVDRHGPVRVAQQPLPLAGAHDRGGSRRLRQGGAGERHGGVVDRGRVPQSGQLGRGVYALAQPGARVALAAPHAPVVEPHQAVAHRGAALHEAVLRALGAQLGGDLLARAPRGRHDPQVGEVQRPVLHFQAAAQLDILHQRAVAHEQVLAPLAREVVLVTLVTPLGPPFQQRRSRGQCRAARAPPRRTPPSRSSACPSAARARARRGPAASRA